MSATTMTQNDTYPEQEAPVETGRPLLAAILVILAVAVYLNFDIEKRRAGQPAAKPVVQRAY